MSRTESELVDYHRSPERKPLGDVGSNDFVIFSRNIYSDELERLAHETDGKGLSFPNYVCYVCTGKDDGRSEYVMFSKEPLCHRGEEPSKDVEIILIADDHVVAQALLHNHRYEMQNRMDIRNIAMTGKVPRQ